MVYSICPWKECDADAAMRKYKKIWVPDHFVNLAFRPNAILLTGERS
jgi:hypothetical protein